MTIDALLVGPSGHGGEEVYVRALRDNPPEDVRYRTAGPFHTGAPGVPCSVVAEILLNRVVHPLAIPDMGFRAFRLDAPLELIHVHAQPVRLRGAAGVPVVMSEGSSQAAYLQEYCGWSDRRFARTARRSRIMYRALGIDDRLLAHERVAAVYVFSEWAREISLRWGGDPDKTEVLYPGFPTPPMLRREERDEFRFLFVGTSFERKGGFELLEAFDAIAVERPEAMLTIISPDPATASGDWMERSWVSAPRRRGAIERLVQQERAGRVRRLELMDRTRLLTEHFASADAFVMPTHAEGFGFTNIEAMSFGLPVISSSAGPIPELVDHARTGLLVTPGDVAGLVAAMRSMLEDREAARRMGAAGRTEFLSRFTLDRFRAGLGEIYRRALAG
jgi:glycosyltransferase involved in cell wall biosynthesis